MAAIECESGLVAATDREREALDRGTVQAAEGCGEQSGTDAPVAVFLMNGNGDQFGGCAGGASDAVSDDAVAHASNQKVPAAIAVKLPEEVARVGVASEGGTLELKDGIEVGGAETAGNHRGLGKWVDLAEAGLVFALVMLHIWRMHSAVPLFWIIPLAIVLGSQAIRREGPRRLGFRMDNFGSCLRWIAPVCLVAFVLLVAVGTERRIGLRWRAGGLLAYCIWGLFQQYVLNGYFVNRMRVGLGVQAAPAVAAMLFTIAHWPNWFLMPITLLGGYSSARMYLWRPNLWALGLAHGTLGFLLYLFVPDSISHHLWVGPGYWRH